MTYKIGLTYTFSFTIHDAVGVLSDADALPTADVFEDDGDVSVDAPTIEKIGAFTGYYRVIVYLDPAIYIADSSYNVIVAATVGGANMAVRVTSFAAETANQTDILAKLNELIVTPGGLMNYENPWFVGNLPAGGTVTIKVYDSLGVEEALDDSDCDEFVPGYYRWSTVNMTTYPGTVGSYFWVMVDSDSGRTTWGVGPIGTPADLAEIVENASWDALRADHTDVGSFGESVPADVIMLRGDATAAGFLKKQYDGTGAVDPTFPATQAQADALITAVGTPVALDSGDASIAGMLTKIADNNGGEDFGAGTDSLHEIALSSGGGATPAQIWAYLLAGDEGTGSAAAALMAAVRTAPVPLVKVNDIFNLRTDIEDQLLSVGIDPTQNLRWRWKTVDRFGNAVTGFPSTVMLSGTELFAQFVGGDLNHSPYKFTLYVRQWNRPEGPWLVADYGIMLGEL